jgi:hypothetical protein
MLLEVEGTVSYEGCHRPSDLLTALRLSYIDLWGMQLSGLFHSLSLNIF